MNTIFPSAFCVCGTDTDVGKTVISALFVAGLNGTYWKPIQCGQDPLTDREQIKMWTGKNDDHFLPEVYRFSHFCAPHHAAELDNVFIDHKKITKPLQISSFPLIVEPAGGLLVPLNDYVHMVDVIKQLDLPVILVTRSSLGTINHTLLSLEILRKKQIPILGVVMNGKKNVENKKAIIRFGKIDQIFEVEPIEEISKSSLETTFLRSFLSER